MKHLCIIVFSIIFFASCEKEFSPNLPTTADDIVVEGYIESGLNATPPYVILTKSIPFFREVKSFSNTFEKGAEIFVSDGTDSVRLQEFCWADLDKNTQKQAANFFNINTDSTTSNFNFCIYIDFTQRLSVKVGKTYFLRIKTQDGRVLTAKTLIPRPIPIDSGLFIKPPGINNIDTFAQMRVSITDPKGADFYRYFTSINKSGYVAARNSVTDDPFFDGQVTKFNLLNSQPRPAGAPDELFGLFRRGDTVSIKFCTIDKAHFDFWQTTEFNSNNGGPFASYTKVKHNITGGIGIWGGYAATYYDTVVPK